MNEWISVKERLPESTKGELSKPVLTITDMEVLKVRYYDYLVKRWTGNPYQHITHWMPLPEPPK